jgi:hypothetical protein
VINGQVCLVRGVVPDGAAVSALSGAFADDRFRRHSVAAEHERQSLKTYRLIATAYGLVIAFVLFCLVLTLAAR